MTLPLEHMDEHLLLQQFKIVKEYMTVNDPTGKLSYHNWKHVDQVLGAARELIHESSIEEQNKEDILLAVIWHDADYAQGGVGHEDRSAALASEHLAASGLSEERVSRVNRLILATKRKHTPKHEDECIIKDADLSHLGTDEYEHFTEKLYQELKETSDEEMSRTDWQQMSLKFMERVQYYTAAARDSYSSKLKMNTDILRQKITTGPGQGPDKDRA